MKKKLVLLSVLLVAVFAMTAMVMVSSLLPNRAMAIEVGESVAEIDGTSYASLQEAINAAETGETVIVLQDVYWSNGNNDGETLKIEAGKNVTIDLNGKTIGQKIVDNGLSVAAIAVRSGATLTIKDSSIEKTGTILACSTAIQLEGTLTLESGTISVSNPTNTDKNPDKGWAYGVWMYMRPNATEAPVFNMTGGAIEISEELLDIHSGYDFANAIAMGEGADGVDPCYDGAVVNITGGTFDGTLYVAENASVTVPENTVINGEVKDVVATVNGANFYTLEGAIKQAQAGDTVTLQSDVSLDTILTLDKAITIDGNGKTLTSSAGRAINVDVASAVTIENLIAAGLSTFTALLTFSCNNIFILSTLISI